jgi:hypothetical protein
MILLKPPHWDAGATKVSPEYQGLWRGIRFAAMRVQPDLINAVPVGTFINGDRETWFGCNWNPVTPISPLNIGTYLCEFRLLTDPGAGSRNPDFGFHNATADNEQVGIRFDNIGNDIMVKFKRNVDAPFDTLEAAISFPYQATWAVTWDDSGSGDATTYKNGVEFSSGHLLKGTGPFTGSTNWGVFTGPDPLEVRYIYAWDRRLSAKEIAQLFTDPFGMFRPPRTRPVYPHYTAKRV